MSYEHISFDQVGSIATITLCRPASLNALNAAIVEELVQAVDRVSDEGSARVLVMTGAGRAFCAGADLQDGSAGRSVGALLERGLNPLLERLFALPMPLIMAVNGVAAGAGCSIALAGDLVLAARSAYFLQAFINIGLVPDVGSTWLLPRLAGRARAQAMMMLGERIPAEQAEQWGLIYRVVDDAALPAEMHGLASRLATGPTQAYRLIRQGLRAALESSLTETLRRERLNQMQAVCTEDALEGAAAFRSKRPPAFKGA
jgi:2-(1,2-epoxy-1,2-dihydrophenyl)acetyl-CoA isomerase